MFFLLKKDCKNTRPSFAKNNYRISTTGQIALPFILLVGGLIVEIVIAGLLVSFFVSASALGERLSVRAFAAANAGIDDAIVRISSNKEFADTPESYQIIIGDDVVSVNISRTVDNPNNIYNYTVEAEATAINRQRKLVVEVVVNKTTGMLSLKSLEEQAVQ